MFPDLGSTWEPRVTRQAISPAKVVCGGEPIVLSRRIARPHAKLRAESPGLLAVRGQTNAPRQFDRFPTSHAATCQTCRHNCLPVSRPIRPHQPAMKHPGFTGQGVSTAERASRNRATLSGGLCESSTSRSWVPPPHPGSRTNRFTSDPPAGEGLKKTTSGRPLPKRRKACAGAAPSKSPRGG